MENEKEMDWQHLYQKLIWQCLHVKLLWRQNSVFLLSNFIQKTNSRIEQKPVSINPFREFKYFEKLAFKKKNKKRKFKRLHLKS